MTPEHKAIKESLITHWPKDPTNALLAKATHAIEALSAEIKRQIGMRERAFASELLANDAEIKIRAERERLAAENAKLRDLLQQMLDVAEHADETGYVADCGFVDLDKLHEKARAMLAPDTKTEHPKYHSSGIFQKQQAQEAAEQIAATSRNMTAEEKSAHDAFFQQAQTTAGLDNAAVKAASDASHKSEKRRDAR